MQAIVGGLGPNGTMMVIGAVGTLTVDSFELLSKRAAVKGWYSGTSVDSEDTLRFCQLQQGHIDERDLPARAGAGGVRPDDERQSALPRGDQDAGLAKLGAKLRF